jgi:hypothetical protein
MKLNATGYSAITLSRLVTMRKRLTTILVPFNSTRPMLFILPTDHTLISFCQGIRQLSRMLKLLLLSIPPTGKDGLDWVPLTRLSESILMPRRHITKPYGPREVGRGLKPQEKI